MSRPTIHDLMEQARTGGAADDPGGHPIRLTEPIVVDDEVMVGKSVRVPMPMVARIDAIAAAFGSDWSKTIRRWIEEGLARDEQAIRGEGDPAAMLQRAKELISAVERQLGEQQSQRAA